MRPGGLVSLLAVYIDSQAPAGANPERPLSTFRAFLHARGNILHESTHYTLKDLFTLSSLCGIVLHLRIWSEASTLIV